MRGPTNCRLSKRDMPIEVSLPEPQDNADDPRNALLIAALRSHKLLEVKSWRLSKESPLPGRLLQGCRLHVMSAADLFLLETPTWGPDLVDVPFVSPSNEYRALLMTRGLVAGAHSCEMAVSDALSELCAVHNASASVGVPSFSDGDGTDDLRTRLLDSFGVSVTSTSAARLATCSQGGRGLVSTRPLCTGETVVRLPAHALLSVSTARSCPVLGPLVPLIDEGAWTEHVVTILLLLHERSKGRASKWVAWLRALPRDMHNLCSWPPPEAALLRGCDAYWRAHASREELREIRAALLPRLRSAAAATATTAAHSASRAPAAHSASRGPADGGTTGSGGANADPFPEASYTLELWVWARSIIETRAIALPAALPGLPAGSLVLAPVIDFANHAAAAELELHVEAPSTITASIATAATTETDGAAAATAMAEADGGRECGALCLRTVCGVPAAGRQLHLSYGAFDAEALLEHHGIVEAAPGYATLRVPLRLTPCAEAEEDDALLASLMMILQHMGLSMDDCVLAEPSPPPPLLQSVSALELPREAERPPPEAAAAPPHALPSRLLGVARLCCITCAEQLTNLPVALADLQALSPANEAAAIALLRTRCEELLCTERDALEDGEAVEVDAPSRGGARMRLGAAAKRARHDSALARRLSRERGELARRFGWRRQRVLSMALEALDGMERGLR